MSFDQHGHSFLLDVPPKNKIAEFYGRCIFSFYCWTVFQRGCTSLYSEYLRVPFVPCPWLFLILSVVNFCHSNGYVIMVDIFLMVNDNGHLFRCFLAIWMSYFVKYLVKSFDHFSLGVCFFLVDLYKSITYSYIRLFSVTHSPLVLRCVPPQAGN